MKEALFWKKINNIVQCQLCPRYCKIEESKTGACRVRKNIKGKLYSLVYEKLCSIASDPIEKKPLFHWSPGTHCLSIATVGCNLSCSFCQNWTISHPAEIFGEKISAEKVIEIAKENNLPGIAYTYTEPLIAIEFYLEIMKLAKKAGLYNVWVSNGFANSKPIKLISKYLDAINVDLKGDTKFYQKLCGVPSEQPVYQALIEYKKAGVWIEITNLIIPTYNDKKEQIEKLVNWIKENLGQETPLHFSRFYPQYKLTNINPTPVSTLEKAIKIAKDIGMKYVYIGNVPFHPAENTYCPNCGNMVIERHGISVSRFLLDKNLSCTKCRYKIPIAGKKWIKR